jgi:hypothetical protein
LKKQFSPKHQKLQALGDELDKEFAHAREIERTFPDSRAGSAAWDREYAVERAYFDAKRDVFFAWRNKFERSEYHKSKPLPWGWAQEVTTLMKRADIAAFDEDMALHDDSASARRRIDAQCAEEYHREKFEHIYSRWKNATGEEKSLGVLLPDVWWLHVRDHMMDKTADAPPPIENDPAATPLPRSLIAAADELRAEQQHQLQMRYHRSRRRINKSAQRRKRAAAFAD